MAGSWRRVMDVAGLGFLHAQAAWRTAPGTAAPSPGGPEVVVSLTSVPHRSGTLHLVIEALLGQSRPPQRIVLWLPAEGAPGDDSLPRLVRRQGGGGLEIRRVASDWPHMKLLPALREWPGAIIITVDDDIIYDRHLVASLLETAGRHPGVVVGHDSRSLTAGPGGGFRPYREWPKNAPDASVPGLAVMPQGVGGVLYPPGVMPAEVHDEALAARLSPRNDDLWFKAVTLRHGVRCVRATGVRRFGRVVSRRSQQRALVASNVHRAGNDHQWGALATHFGLTAAHLDDPSPSAVE
jgi:hypothetical protein